MPGVIGFVRRRNRTPEVATPNDLDLGCASRDSAAKEERIESDSADEGLLQKPRLLGRLGDASGLRGDGAAGSKSPRGLWESARHSPRALQSVKKSMQAKSWRRVRREALQELIRSQAGPDQRSSQLRSSLAPSSHPPGVDEPLNVDVQKLADLGITSSQFSRAIYDRVRAEALPNFLRHLRIDPDGGIDRILDIWTPSKVFWFFVLAASVVFNVASILALNWTLTQGYIDNVKESMTVVVNTRTASMKNLHLNVSHVNAGLSQQEVDIFDSIQDPESRSEFLSIAILMATFEVSWIVASILDCFRKLWLFSASTCEFTAFTSLRRLFQEALPHLSAFSAISLIAKAHPSLIMHEYDEYLAKSRCRQCCAGSAMLSVWFFLTRFVLAAIAVSAFAVKVVATGLKLISPSVGPVFKWAAVVALLNNCMGCITVGRLLEERILMFVFSGQDSEFQEDERALRNVYQCRVCREIWSAFSQSDDPWGTWKAIILLATLDHYDLQALLIEPVEIPPSVGSPARSLCDGASHDRMSP